MGHGTNDFSNWLEDRLSEKKLADKIASLDPYGKSPKYPYKIDRKTEAPLHRKITTG